MPVLRCHSEAPYPLRVCRTTGPGGPLGPIYPLRACGRPRRVWQVRIFFEDSLSSVGCLHVLYVSCWICVVLSGRRSTRHSWKKIEKIDLFFEPIFDRFFNGFWLPFGLHFRWFPVFFASLFRIWNLYRFCIDLGMDFDLIFNGFLMTFPFAHSPRTKPREPCFWTTV